MGLLRRRGEVLRAGRPDRRIRPGKIEKARMKLAQVVPAANPDEQSPPEIKPVSTSGRDGRKESIMPQTDHEHRIRQDRPGSRSYFNKIVPPWASYEGDRRAVRTRLPASKTSPRPCRPERGRPTVAMGATLLRRERHRHGHRRSHVELVSARSAGRNKEHHRAARRDPRRTCWPSPITDGRDLDASSGRPVLLRRPVPRRTEQTCATLGNKHLDLFLLTARASAAGRQASWAIVGANDYTVHPDRARPRPSATDATTCLRTNSNRKSRCCPRPTVARRDPHHHATGV